jgi:1-aminocyclopropane-1-carboxylate deaminase/D-cysteine desulfhydrase-like pyridoxal-dependent ACC family enzyme
MNLNTLFNLDFVDEPFNHIVATENNIQISIRRFDKIHPEAGGNKVFKLQFWLKEIEKYRTIISFGGAFSNHLLALSAVCKMLNVKSVGIIRGEKPEVFNHYLNALLENKMELIFVTREAYKNKTNADFLADLHLKFPNSLIIPEGGAGVLGVEGAKQMVKETEPYDYIVLPCATGTTLAGIAWKNANSKILGFQVLKGENIIQNELKKIAQLDLNSFKNVEINTTYHFGGYAKFTAELLDFQQEIYRTTHIPFDKVYGIKAIYGMLSEIKKGKISKDAKILYIHTGGNFDFC